MAAKDLRLARAKLIKDAQAVANSPLATNESVIEANRMLVAADALKTQIDRSERIDSLHAELGQEIGRRMMQPGSEYALDAAAQKRIFNRIIAGRPLADADKAAVASVVARDLRILTALMGGRQDRLSAEDGAHFRASYVAPQNAASGGTTTAGGYTIAPLFQAELLVALKAFGGMRAVARHITTDTGAALPQPILDDTSNLATIIGTENTTLSAGTDLAFSQKSLGAFTYAVGPLPVSLQLLQDSTFDFGSIIEAAIVNRFGRKQNNDFTTGAGTTLPFGVITGAALGTTGANGQTTSITGPDFVNLVHSVDPSYRDGARFMFRDSTLQALTLLLDNTGRPLFVPSIAAGVPDTIANYPYTINPSLPAMVANAKSVLFGNFSRYVIRDVTDMRIAVLRERFADSLQVAWLAYMRSDGNLISAGSPIKYYQNSSI